MYAFTTPEKDAGCRAKDAAEKSQNAPTRGTKRSILRMMRLISVAQLARFWGVPPAAISALIELIAITREQDWTQGGRPIVFQQQNRLAREIFGRSDRTIRRWEAALADAGLIIRATGGNGARNGHEKTGLDLSPMLDRLDEIENLLAAVLSQRAMHKAEIGEAKRLRRMIVDQTGYAPATVTRRVTRIMGLVVTWPRRLADLSLAALSRHVMFLRNLLRWMTFATFRRDDLDAQMQSKMSGPADAGVRPYTPEEDNESCRNREENQQGQHSEGDKGSNTEDEDRNGEQSTAPDQDHATETGLPTPLQRHHRPARISPETILSAATPAMRAHLHGFEDSLNAVTNSPDQRILTEIARTRAFELGIDRWLLDKASHHLPPMAFLFAVLVLDSNRFHPVQAHRTRNPGALLLTFLRRAAVGSLDLNSALLGIIDRVQKGRQTPSAA